MRATVAARLLCILAVVAVLGACSDGGSGTGEAAGEQPAGDGMAGDDYRDDGGIRPPVDGPERISDAPAGLGPLDPPPGFTAVTGEGFTLHVPAGFEKQEGTSGNGEPMLVFSRGGSSGGAGPLVGVVRDTKWGRSSALEQSLVLESAKRLLAEAEVRRTVVAWPGALAAVIVDWTQEQQDVSGARRTVRTVQLIVDVNDRVSLSVVAVAPADGFDESGVATILRTFRPDLATS